jgi:hypothetical protein
LSAYWLPPGSGNLYFIVALTPSTSISFHKAAQKGFAPDYIGIPKKGFKVGGVCHDRIDVH